MTSNPKTPGAKINAVQQEPSSEGTGMAERLGEAQQAVSSLYDPNHEQDESQRKAALYWELLRRNPEFSTVCRNWVSDPAFRQEHCRSAAYGNQAIHFPRCALAWMLTPKARAELAKFEWEQKRWFRSPQFNFGPIRARREAVPSGTDGGYLCNRLEIKQLRSSGPVISIVQAWPQTNPRFQEQFLRSIERPVKIVLYSDFLRETSELLRVVSTHLHKDTSLKNVLEFAGHLYDLSFDLADMGQRNLVIGVPNVQCPPGQIARYLDDIRKHCSDAGIVNVKYQSTGSWLGTAEAWRWFLVAEHYGYTRSDPGQMYQLARLYSEDLQARRGAGKGRRNAWQHSPQRARSKSEKIKNRRHTVEGFLALIEGWRDDIYPPERWLARI